MQIIIVPWKHSKFFSPAQIIIILFKDFFACKNVLDANHHYLGNIQRLFRLQSCFRCKSSIPWKYSKFFACKIVLSGKIQRFFACKIVLDANRHYPENIRRLFRLQDCLGRKPSLCWKYSKTFSPAKIS